MPKNKVYHSFDLAVQDIPDGATIMMHSFLGPSGIPQNLIQALRRQGAKDLTIIGCNTGVGFSLVDMLGLKPFVAANILIENHQVRKVYATWALPLNRTSARGARERNSLVDAINRGEIEWVPSPMGVLAEQIRAGAAGLGGFYSRIGVGTLLEKGREKKVIDGVEYLLYKPLKADFAFVRAFRADRAGNLVYRGTERSYNPLYAAAAKTTIVEAEHIVEVGEIDPEHVITPGVYVDRIVEVPKEQQRPL